MTPLQRIHAAVDYVVQNLSWLPAGVNAAATVGAAISFALVGDVDDLNVGFLVLGTACTLLSIGLTIAIERWRRANKQGEREEAAQLQIVVTDAIMPLLADVAKMPKRPTSTNQKMLPRVIGNVSPSLKLFLPEAKRLRVVVYTVETKSDGRRRLVVTNAVGRKDSPRFFAEGDGGRGDAAFRMLSRGESIFVADVNKSALPGKERSGSGYRTFISASIVADELAYGMLSVDAPFPGDLDENDVPMVEVVAAILAIAFAEASKN